MASPPTGTSAPASLKVLVVGNGGREHALAWRCAQSPRVAEVLVAPGNAGTAREPRLRNVAVAASDHAALIALARREGVGLTLIGPEAPLVAGIVDDFRAAGLACFGPSRAAAQLEGSKAFTKEFLRRHGIPTAAYRTFTRENFDADWVRAQRAPLVVKASGLAAGKGVIIAATIGEALEAIAGMFAGRFGAAGDQVVVEEFLRGEEASFIVMADGEHVLPFASSQDHKRVGDGDAGPNTGGMGAYSPAPVVTPAVHARVMREIIEPTIRGLAADGTPYTGFLYAGLMIDRDGTPKVIEYNCRFGDPEAQPVMLRLESDLTRLCEAAIAGRLDRETIAFDPRAALGVVMAAAGYPDTVRTGDAIRGLDAAARLPGKVFLAGAQLAPQPTAPPSATPTAAVVPGSGAAPAVVTSGGRVLCAVGLGGTVGAAQAEAYALVRAIDFEGAHYRRDIGYRAIERERAG